MEEQQKTQAENVKLKKELEELKHREYCLRQDAKGHSPSEVQEYRDEIEGLKKKVKELEDRDFYLIQTKIDEGIEMERAQFELSEAVLEQKIEKLEREIESSEKHWKDMAEKYEGEGDWRWAEVESYIERQVEKQEELKKEKEKLKKAIYHLDNVVVKELQRKATIYEYMAEYLEKTDEFWCYFDYIREYHPDEREAAGDILTSDEEVEDNDPEEYGEYMYRQGLTAEEIAKGDTIDAETGEEKVGMVVGWEGLGKKGEVKIDMEKEEKLLKAEIEGGEEQVQFKTAPQKDRRIFGAETMVMNIRDFLFDKDKFSEDITWKDIAQLVKYEDTKNETEERYYEERPHLKE